MRIFLPRCTWPSARASRAALCRSFAGCGAPWVAKVVHDSMNQGQDAKEVAFLRFSGIVGILLRTTCVLACFS